ncbi:asparaginase [Kineococcus rhizosphaerae]|uniref:L-asparaginase n=1 Tax=Kineococcus rhizosphaerae TaxID=559628 RepID=A0A2T0QUU7_9ACTN|nr:asparaginase [Kineococcus rhizosphaerae]PRY08947.1 L-asparaginase [Kineococcus rhizosphaerae]
MTAPPRPPRSPGPPLVLVAALGGTIASLPAHDGRHASPQLSGAELLAAVPGIERLARLEPLQFRQEPSGYLRPADVVELAEVVRKRSSEVDGIVITQGTDTLEETAFLLSLLLEDTVPVVLTGAMRNAGQAGADGPANLLAAVRVAVDPRVRTCGPVVVFNDEIHLPHYVRKGHTSQVSAFSSPGLGPVGWVVEDRVRLPLQPRTRERVPLPDGPPTSWPRIPIVTLGMGAELPEVVASGACQGLVLESYGAGHVPGWTVDALTAVSQTMPVVIASRTGSGELYRHTYDYPGSETDLLARGLISARHLDGLKARLLLGALLAAGVQRGNLQSEFDRILC